MAESQPLHGKTALVTGAGRGLGRAIALRLAADGARVGIHYGRSEEAAREVLEAIGGNGFLVQGDFATMEGVEAAASQVDQLDILVNNAGLQVPDQLIEITVENFDTLFQINVKAVFFLTQRLLPKISDGGRIVNLSSGLSQAAFPEKGVYGMTKAAINAFTRSLAKQVGGRGITVNAVAPGVVGTDMNPWARSGPGAERMAATIPLGRVATPEDIADVVAFLCSDDARWITGTYIDASGGQHLH